MNYPFPQTVNAKINSIIENKSGSYIFAGEDIYGKNLATEFIVNQLLKSDLNSAKRNFSNSYIMLSPEQDKALSIKAVHELGKKIWQKTNEKNRVVQVNGVDNISLEAANAMLKSLEDSPANTIFILVCDQVDNILPTIISRSQIIYFNNPATVEGSNYISENFGIDVSKANELLSNANNNISLALKLNDQEYKKDYLDLNNSASEFLSGTITDRFVIAEHIHSQKQTKKFLNHLVYTLQNQSTILNQVVILEDTLLAIKELSANVNSRLVVENLALKIKGEN